MALMVLDVTIDLMQVFGIQSFNELADTVAQIPAGMPLLPCLLLVKRALLWRQLKDQKYDAPDTSSVIADAARKRLEAPPRDNLGLGTCTE
eukprot:gene7158-1693_t